MNVINTTLRKLFHLVVTKNPQNIYSYSYFLDKKTET